MAQILRTTLINDETVAADGVEDYDLPVNPLSFIALTVKALNATLTDFRFISALLSMITNVRVAYRGASIIDGSLTDLAVLFSRLTGYAPFQGNVAEADNDVRHVTCFIPFGRKLYDPIECFPATRRGDLVMHLTRDIAVTGADGLILQAETVELLDATPERFVKATTTTKLFNATGDHDIELPIGNMLLGALLWGPITPTGASFNASWGSTRLMVDNVEQMVSATNWETLHGELMGKQGAMRNLMAHIHSVNAAGAGREDTLQQQEDFDLLNGYAFIDLDPMQDGSLALDTANAARVHLRTNTETASATALRALPVELVATGQAGSPAQAGG